MFIAGKTNAGLYARGLMNDDITSNGFNTDIKARPEAVWGTGPDDYYTVGEYGLVLHYPCSEP